MDFSSQMHENLCMHLEILFGTLLISLGASPTVKK